LAEFRENTINFREKYNIKEKYIILNVSSFFYGKGQEILPKVSKRLSKNIDDFVILSVSNSIKYPYDKVFFERCKRQSKGQNIRFMRDLPREDVVAAFNASDIFLFTSKKEVAPLVILESRAAMLPFVALDVGNIRGQHGGGLVTFEDVDNKGYAIADEDVIRHLSTMLEHCIYMDRSREYEVKKGQEDIEKIDWKNIVPKYNEVFSR